MLDIETLSRAIISPLVGGAMTEQTRYQNANHDPQPNT
jgi:hypothetical protein